MKSAGNCCFKPAYSLQFDEKRPTQVGRFSFHHSVDDGLNANFG
ncbi:hypothetical protein VCG_003258 [Vibrio cholerae 12129(1)]|nr:hypothetical protein VCG_003258 [Vibrio cholerae 12129(1)]